MMLPEILALDRLVLRKPRASDAEAIYEYGSDPEVAKYADWPLVTHIKQIKESLAQRLKLWESGADFYWVIVQPKGDRPIGAISCSITGDTADFGYLLHRRHWGMGFATEASKGLLGLLLADESIKKVWATCDAENKASIRVLEKVGLFFEKRMPKSIIRPNLSPQPRDALLYSLVKPRSGITTKATGC